MPLAQRAPREKDYCNGEPYVMTREANVMVEKSAHMTRLVMLMNRGAQLAQLGKPREWQS